MSLISDADIAQFHDQGYFVTDVVIDTPDLESLAKAFDEVHAEQLATAEREGDEAHVMLMRKRPFIGQFHKRSEAAARFVKLPIYVEACRKLIGPDADLYFNQAVIKPPHEGMEFAWHQDSGYTETDPLEYITCWTAISRTFVENGCIWIIPGSHKLGVLPHPRSEADNALHAQFEDVIGDLKEEPVEMKAGQVAIFSSLMLHRSGPNTSDEIRRGYVPQYHHPGVVGKHSGKPFGDQFPVLRDGQAV